ncbi:TolC family protein [Aeoliella sp. ICT_H6.2]|uniref:TolC family protein n=1 Tax=Aeoliella straminimaris TaxID=2954799 RepID=A0A9X2FF28_9BACT|nr:TolC family protein [Aeoliella straminimaris]MCO6047529.1 TolC family protein [Aeoliella straminimaris]
MESSPQIPRDALSGGRNTPPRLARGRSTLGWLLLACCATAGLAGSVSAQVRPFVPSLDCCPNQYDPCCPSKAASCIPLPTVRVTEEQIYADPTAANRWPITVYEAIGIALNNSEVVRNLGLVDAQSKNDLVQSKLTTYDPAIADAEAAAQWGIFDPLWTTEMNWDRQDLPPGVSFSGIGNRPPQLDYADFVTSIDQLLPGGTRFGVDEVVNYLFNPEHPVGLDPNPQYYSYTQFRFNQPMLRNFGMDANMAKIRIAAAEAERTDWNFKTETLALVRSVETAYWDLYSAEQNLRALDEVLPMFREIVRVREQRQEAQAGTSAELSRAKAEMFRYEQARLQMISVVAEQRLVLRNLMGLKPGDGTFMTTLAVSTLSPPIESLESAVYTALRQRPDVLRQRLAVYVAKQEKTLACNSLKPLLDFNAFWRINGLGDDLGSSFGVQANDDYNSWQMGLTFQMPLGRREAKSNVRATQLNIRKERALLDQVAHQASFQVADAHRRIVWLYQQYGVAQDRVNALRDYGEAARAQLETPPPGMSGAFALELYVQHLREFTDSMYHVNSIVSDFNSAVARFEEVKGTLLTSRLVEIEGDGTGAIPEEVLSPEDARPMPGTQPTPGTEPAPPSPEQPLTQAQPRAQDPAATVRQPASAPQSIYNLPPDPLSQQPAATDPVATATPPANPRPTITPAVPEVARVPSNESVAAPAIAPQRAPSKAAAPIVQSPPPVASAPAVASPQPVAQAPATLPQAPQTIAVPRVAQTPVAPAPSVKPQAEAIAAPDVAPLAQPDLITGQQSRDLSPAPRGLRRPTTQVRPYSPPTAEQSVVQTQPKQQSLPPRPLPMPSQPQIAMGPSPQPNPPAPSVESQPKLELQQPTLAPYKLQQPVVRGPLQQPQAAPQLELQQPSLAPHKLQQPIARAPQPRVETRPMLQLQQPTLAPHKLQQPVTQSPLRQPPAASPAMQGPVLQQPVMQPPTPKSWTPLAQVRQPQEMSRSTQPAASKAHELPNFEVRQAPSQPSPALAQNSSSLQQPAMMQQLPLALSNPLALVPADRYQQPRWRPLEPLQSSRETAALPALEISQPQSTMPIAVQAAPIPFVAVMQPQTLLPGDTQTTLVNTDRTQTRFQLQQPASQQPQLRRSTYQSHVPSMARENLSQPTFVR